MIREILCMSTRIFKAYVVSSALVLAALIAAALPVSMAAATSNTVNPQGNNGFVKVNDETLSDNTPNNDPHVSCNFKVEFYNYDYNPAYRAHVTFELQNPTAGSDYALSTQGDTAPLIGQDSAGGGNDLDAVRSYKLTFTGQPHDKQGYHVKLTVNADGSHGADTKHKVFWVQPCHETSTTNSDGHVLGEAASTTIPSSLPSTGTNSFVALALTSVATLAAYALTLRFQASSQKA